MRLKESENKGSMSRFRTNKPLVLQWIENVILSIECFYTHIPESGVLKRDKEGRTNHEKENADKSECTVSKNPRRLPNYRLINLFSSERM